MLSLRLFLVSCVSRGYLELDVFVVDLREVGDAEQQSGQRSLPYLPVFVLLPLLEAHQVAARVAHYSF